MSNNASGDNRQKVTTDKVITPWGDASSVLAHLIVQDGQELVELTTPDGVTTLNALESVAAVEFLQHISTYDADAWTLGLTIGRTIHGSHQRWCDPKIHVKAAVEQSGRPGCLGRVIVADPGGGVRAVDGWWTVEPGATSPLFFLEQSLTMVELAVEDVRSIVAGGPVPQGLTAGAVRTLLATALEDLDNGIPAGELS